MVQIGTDDNIFEAMRLIIPEHREAMERIDRDAKRRKRPELADDAIDEMQQVLAEALKDGARIQVTVFNEWADKVYEGIPEMRGNALYIVDGDERRRMEIADVVRIEKVAE